MAEEIKSDSDRPELLTYRSVLEKAIRDGRGSITSTKAQILIKLRSSLGISEFEHNKIMDALVNKYEEANLITYRSAIEQALIDDRLTADEEKILELLRISMNISMDEHLKIVNQIKSKLALERKEGGFKVRRPGAKDESYPIQEDTPDENIDEGQSQVQKSQFENETDDPYYWVRKGELIWVSSEGNINKALKALTYFDRAIELDPDNYLAWANKGLILKTLDKVDEALLCYNRALKLNPGYITVWYNKGVLLGSIGNFKEAIKSLNKVLELNPDHEFAQRDKSILLSLLDKNDRK